jgi:hypothetical protein
MHSAAVHARSAIPYGNCVTVTVVSATVSVPVRLTPVLFGKMVYANAGESDVANDFETMIQSTPDLIVHPQPVVADVFITNTVPDARIPTFLVAGVTAPGMKVAVTL